MTVASPDIAAAAAGGGIPITWILLALLAVFWVFLITQNRKRRAAQISQRDAIGIGSTVLLTSGFIGTLVSREGDQAEIELAPGLTVKVLVGAIARTVDDTPVGTAESIDAEPFGTTDAGLTGGPVMPDAPRRSAEGVSAEGRSTGTADTPVSDTGSTGASASQAESAITEDGAPRRD